MLSIDFTELSTLDSYNRTLVQLVHFIAIYLTNRLHKTQVIHDLLFSILELCQYSSIFHSYVNRRICEVKFQNEAYKTITNDQLICSYILARVQDGTGCILFGISICETL